MQAVLGYAASKGIEVNVLIWFGSKLFSHYPRDAQRGIQGRTGDLSTSNLNLLEMRDGLNRKNPARLRRPNITRRTAVMACADRVSGTDRRIGAGDRLETSIEVELLPHSQQASDVIEIANDRSGINRLPFVASAGEINRPGRRKTL